MYYSRGKIRKTSAARLCANFSARRTTPTSYAPKALRSGGNTVISREPRRTNRPIAPRRQPLVATWTPRHGCAGRDSPGHARGHSGQGDSGRGGSGDGDGISSRLSRVTAEIGSFVRPIRSGSARAGLKRSNQRFRRAGARRASGSSSNRCPTSARSSGRDFDGAATSRRHQDVTR
jgi:hypothetical protein